MFETIFGLPVHVLVIHAVVVLMPLASLSVLVSAFWPRFRRWAGPLPLILSVVATALVPVATQSGDWLAQTIGAIRTRPSVPTVTWAATCCGGGWASWSRRRWSTG